MKIAVIGAGYVGLVSATCFAEMGHEVICVEKVPEKLSKLRNSIVPFFEPGLEALLKKNIDSGRLTFEDDFSRSLKDRKAVFLCVGTPQSDSGKADLNQVEEAVRYIARAASSPLVLVEKSTVPVNTHQLVKRTLRRYSESGLEHSVASNPEFLREGSAIKDFMEPDRIVIGTEADWAKEVLEAVYEPILRTGRSLLATNPATAELIKHASNSFLAMKISYINMLALLCEKTGADIGKVADGVGADRRIGRAFLSAGIGYGGSCFPKDVKAFIHMANDAGVDFGILEKADEVNALMRSHFIEKMEKALWNFAGKKIAVWGLAFKNNTDDIREAPAIDVVAALLAGGATVRLYDPEAAGNFRAVFPEGERVLYHSTAREAAAGADALVICTDWDEFKDVDLREVKRILSLPILFDGRNLFDPQHVLGLGFEYYSIGR